MEQSNQDVLIDYTNWRGERATRRVRPTAWAFASSEWHPNPQWLMRGFDFSKAAFREFAVKDIHSWQPVNQ